MEKHSYIHIDINDDVSVNTNDNVANGNDDNDNDNDNDDLSLFADNIMDSIPATAFSRPKSTPTGTITFILYAYVN